MGLATLGGIAFRIDPRAISWNYSIKTAVTETVGGRVVQCFGTEISDMTVQGQFSSWQEQDAFLDRVHSWIDQATSADATPVRFMYPPRGWDFLVYVSAFTQPGGGDSIELASGIFAPPWALTLAIIEDNHGLRAVKEDALKAYINRLATGIGWRQTEFNGPMGAQYVEDFLGREGVGNIQELLVKGMGGTPE